jgi:predicted unusual protein kinase regulating ubiquinone biosynthesis (AarF/ABC1/UbiB family)
MYSQFTTPRVLVMQWIEGERLRSASSQAPAAAAAVGAAGGVGSVLQQQSAGQVAEDLRLVEIGVRCSLEQMLEEGFYHAGDMLGLLLETA